MSCVQNANNSSPVQKEISMEEYNKRKQKIEDQVDYQFIQRIIQELTQTCAPGLSFALISV